MECPMDKIKELEKKIKELQDQLNAERAKCPCISCPKTTIIIKEEPIIPYVPYTPYVPYEPYPNTSGPLWKRTEIYCSSNTVDTDPICEWKRRNHQI